MSVNFYLESRTDKDGNAPIRASVSIKGARLTTSTGLKVQPDKWNKAKQRVKQGATAASIPYNVANATLAKIIEALNSYEAECVANGTRPDQEAIRRTFAKAAGRGIKKRAEAAAIWEALDAFTKEVGKANQWTRATQQKFAALKRHLQRFNARLRFSDLTEAGLTDFVAYLRDDQEMKNSTIGKQIGFLKWFLRWAANKGYNDNNDFANYNPKLKTTKRKVIFLDWEELMAVFNYQVPADGTEVTLTNPDGTTYTKEVRPAASLEIARDIFCFCAFTSLRYSDAVNLKRADISGEAMTITTVKTADTITIELNKYAKAILAKYKDADFGGKALPYITNQKMNYYIKDVCELCGINKPVTQTYYRGSQRIDETAPKYAMIGTHCGRRTFICNALALGIPAETVMKWTGHSDYKSMKPYVEIADEAKAKAMGLFDQL